MAFNNSLQFKSSFEFFLLDQNARIICSTEDRCPLEVSDVFLGFKQVCLVFYIFVQ